MTALNLPPERRRRRSKEAGKALMLQLEHIFEHSNLRNFTLGDAQGLVIAHAGEGAEADVLAAYAPLLARCTDRARRARIFEKIRNFVPGANEHTVHVRTFEVDGEEMFLCVLGAPGIYQQVGLYRAVTGVRRILRQAQLAA